MWMKSRICAVNSGFRKRGLGLLGKKLKPQKAYISSVVELMQRDNTSGYNAVGANNFLEAIPTEVIFEHRDTRRENEDKDRAAYLHGNRVDWGLAFYDRVSTPGVLEGCFVAIVLWPYYLGLHFSSLAR